MQITLQTNEEFVAPLAPCFRDLFRPKTLRYRGKVGQKPIRSCACGSLFLAQTGRGSPRCAACRERYKWREQASTRRARKLSRKFGITTSEYESMSAAQQGLCAICGKPEKPNKRLAVDHCHKSGVVRGLLCSLCNTAIGKLGDSPELLRRAIAYLEAK